MKFDPAGRLRSHMDSIKNRGGLTYAEMVDILRRARLVIESPLLKKNYPVLSLYCDWVMHGELGKNPGGHEVLRAIDKSIADTWHSDPAGVHDAVNQALDLGGLRKEIIRLFEANRIDSTIFSVKGNWLEFLRALLMEIAERPIIFPDNVATDQRAKGRKAFLAMQNYRASKGVPLDFSVTRVAIAYREKDGSDPPGYYWHARIKEDSPEHFVQIIGPVDYSD
ncbi:hypothetical protein SRABI118_03823 [Massilia sp. Bi118]|uniref:hypothetical protein n=1 Tax=Massilia sp. Bi118 TaxID=2822346 RepID=UPI001DD64B8E|nr:hypothetical protein [Massilia sp. Bi118]CAH0282606.1 hypothetical protein SRABI118_03823 [Massilia sp. Bi118]